MVSCGGDSSEPQAEKAPPDLTPDEPLRAPVPISQRPVPTPSPPPPPASTESLATACEAGDVDACAYHGQRLERGFQSARDLEQAYALYKRSCTGGSMLGCIWMVQQTGRQYERVEIVATYKRACDAGELEGCYWLAIAHWRGAGVAEDSRRMEELLERACDGGLAKACTFLGLRLEAGDASGMPRDEARAEQLYVKGCENGDPAGCDRMGQRLNGSRSDLPKFPDKADEYWKLALAGYQRQCHEHDGDGCYDLAQLYWQGRGTPRDDSKRFEYVERACEYGNGWPCYALGQSRAKGAPGLSRDGQRAAYWYARACTQGYLDGCRATGEAMLVALVTEDAEPRLTGEQMAAIADAVVRDERTPPESDKYLARMGAIRLFRKDYQGALEAFTGALARAEEPGEHRALAARFGLAIALEKAGRKGKSRQAYRRFLEQAVGEDGKQVHVVLDGNSQKIGPALERARSALGK